MFIVPVIVEGILDIISTVVQIVCLVVPIRLLVKILSPLFLKGPQQCLREAINFLSIPRGYMLYLPILFWQVLYLFVSLVLNSIIVTFRMLFQGNFDNHLSQHRSKEKIQNLPIYEQILELERELQSCDDTMKIIEITNLIQEKKKQLSTGVSVSNSVHQPKSEPEVGIADHFSQLEIWLLNGNIKDARALINRIIDNGYSALSELQQKKVKELLQRLQNAEQPKRISPESSNSSSSKLVKLRILLANGNIKQAREVADEIMATDSGQYSPTDIETLERLCENLHRQEMNASQNTSIHLASRNDTLEKEKEKLLSEIKILQAEKPMMQQEIQKLRPSYEEFLRLQRITATIMADIYQKNKAILLSEKVVTFFVQEYLASSPRGGNINSLASIREAILGGHFDESIKPYIELAKQQD